MKWGEAMLNGKKIIALCLARIQDDVSQEFVTALSDVLKETQYSLFVYCSSSPVDEEKFREDPQMAVFDYMDYSVIDVVIIHEEFMRNQAATDYLIQKAQSNHIPVMVIGESHEGCINLLFDREQGFAETVRHMVEHHHYTDLHFMGGIKGNPFSEHRLQMFKNVLEENNLPFDDSMVSYGDFWSGPTEVAMLELFKRESLPRAIICANDMMAITVCDMLQKKNINIPADVAVSGFDGIEQVKFSSPRITTCTCDVNDFCQKALELLEHIEEYKGQTKTFYVPAKLTIGESCGCEDGRKPERVADYLYLENDRFYRYQDEDLTLAKVTAQIQKCETVEQVAKAMQQDLFYDMTCLIEPEYLDETVECDYDPEEEKLMQRDMVLLYNSDYVRMKKFEVCDFPLKEVIPRLDYMMEHGRTLIFTALHYMNVPMGYLCFHFGQMEFGNYVKIPQTVTAVNNAIGAYKNLRYANYLMRRIDEMYKTDALTGLYNRRAFDMEYSRFLQDEERPKRLTIILADLDRLKYINDNFGHKEGDFAIQTVAQALMMVCPAESIFTRFGGDEMLGVCPGELDVEHLKEGFDRYFREFNAHSKKPYPVEASIGINVSEEGEMLSFEQLVEKVDKLMYIEKEEHRRLRGQTGR